MEQGHAESAPANNDHTDVDAAKMRHIEFPETVPSRRTVGDVVAATEWLRYERKKALLDDYEDKLGVRPSW